MELCTVTDLDRKKAMSFIDFTYAPYRWKLEKAGSENIIAAGAELGGCPVGLALAEKNAVGDMSVISVIVAEDLRLKGIGSKLISKIGEIASQRGFVRITAEYAGGKPYTQVVEHILAKQGWSSPVTKSIVYRCLAIDKGAGEFPWWLSYRMDKLPNEILMWKDVSEKELKSLQNADWFPQGLSPFVNMDMIDARYSLAVKVNGEIAGWIVYHTIRRDTTVCKTLYVREDMRSRGFAPIMVIKSIQLQYETGIRNFMFTIHNGNSYVLPMVRRWMGKYIVSAVEWWQTEKQL